MSFNIADEDLDIQLVYEQTGTTTPPGGQHAGMPATAVRVVHIPTGIVAQCGAHRSTHKNKTIALEMIEFALLSLRG
jgi:protein subunit release factor A